MKKVVMIMGWTVALSSVQGSANTRIELSGDLKIEYVCTPIFDGAPALSPDHCSIRFYTEENSNVGWCRGGPAFPGSLFGNEGMGNQAGCPNTKGQGPAVGQCDTGYPYFEHEYAPYDDTRPQKPGTTTYPIETENAEAARVCITQMMREFSQRCYVYSPIPRNEPAANSNSLAANALRCCGITPPKPSWAPGNDQILPCIR